MYIQQLGKWAQVEVQDDLLEVEVGPRDDHHEKMDDDFHAEIQECSQQPLSIFIINLYKSYLKEIIILPVNKSIKSCSPMFVDKLTSN